LFKLLVSNNVHKKASIFKIILFCLCEVFHLIRQLLLKISEIFVFFKKNVNLLSKAGF